jgi:hypothetical protein
MSFGLGFWAAAGGGAAPAGGVAFEQIATTILSSNTSSISFSITGLGSTYKHLQLRYVERDSTNDIYGQIVVRFNGDTGSNYSGHTLRGNGSSVTSSGAANGTIITTGTGNTAPSGAFTGGIIDILDAFSTAKLKTVRILTGRVTPGDNEILFQSAAWQNTAALTSISVAGNGTNMLTGSRFSLYGIRG